MELLTAEDETEMTAFLYEGQHQECIMRSNSDNPPI